MLWACILLPQLGLDSVLRRHPEPDQPLAIVGGPAQRRELLAVNDAAAAAGLHPGQRLAAAHALHAHFAMIEHDPTAIARWQQFLAAWAYRYSSQVFAGWPNAIALEAKASFQIMGQWPKFEASLRQDLTDLGFQHRIALAPTAHAARVLAGVHDGVAIQNDQQLENILGGVPVLSAYLPDNAGERLHAMGVRRLRELFALPRDGLRRRFGNELLLCLDRMLGRAPELLTFYRPPDVFDVRVELNYEISNHLALVFPVRRLVSDLAAYLAGRDGGVQQFVVRLEHEDHAPTDMPVGLLAAERDPRMLFELTRTRLEQVQIPKPVVAVRLIARQLPPFVPTGQDLFNTQPANAVPWESLRERLRARLGNNAVYQIAPCTDPRPEHAWQRHDGQRLLDALDRPARPTWLLHRPIPLRDANPTILAGPERLESGWWDGDDARRDYYILETSRGQRAWAFAPVGQQGPWMLHGWFA
jgi:protein ImuB